MQVTCKEHTSIFLFTFTSSECENQIETKGLFGTTARGALTSAFKKIPNTFIQNEFKEALDERIRFLLQK
jgi:hypothetical protein